MNPLLQVILAEANARAQELKEARSGDAHFSPKQPGQLGMLLILDDANPMIKALAKAIGVPSGYKATKVGELWAAYNPGDRLSIAEHKEDLMEDEVNGK